MIGRQNRESSKPIDTYASKCCDRYPVTIVGNDRIPLTMQLGGVTTRSNRSRVVDGVRAVLLRYALLARDADEYRRARAFEHTMLMYLLSFDTDEQVPVHGTRTVCDCVCTD